jgi:hypothetical protein
MRSRTLAVHIYMSMIGVVPLQGERANEQKNRNMKTHLPGKSPPQRNPSQARKRSLPEDPFIPLQTPGFEGEVVALQSCSAPRCRIAPSWLPSALDHLYCLPSNHSLPSSDPINCRAPCRRDKTILLLRPDSALGTSTRTLNSSALEAPPANKSDGRSLLAPTRQGPRNIYPELE